MAFLSMWTIYAFDFAKVIEHKHEISVANRTKVVARILCKEAMAEKRSDFSQEPFLGIYALIMKLRKKQCVNEVLDQISTLWTCGGSHIVLLTTNGAFLHLYSSSSKSTEPIG